MKFGGKGGIDVGVTQAEAHGAVRRDDFEEDGEKVKGVVADTLQSAALDNGYEEKT